jgi:hypothetical protein
LRFGLRPVFTPRALPAIRPSPVHARVGAPPQVRREARCGIGAWLRFYNDDRPHQAHDYRTPREVFTGVALGYVDNVSTLPTYPWAQQQQEKAFIGRGWRPVGRLINSTINQRLISLLL